MEVGNGVGATAGSGGNGVAGLTGSGGWQADSNMTNRPTEYRPHRAALVKDAAQERIELPLFRAEMLSDYCVSRLFIARIEGQHIVDECLSTVPRFNEFLIGKMSPVSVNVKPCGCTPVSHEVRELSLLTRDASERLDFSSGSSRILAALVSYGVDALLGRFVQESSSRIGVGMTLQQQLRFLPVIPGPRFVEDRPLKV